MIQYHNQREYRQYLRSVIERFKYDLEHVDGIDIGNYVSGFPEERQGKIGDFLERILIKYLFRQPEILQLLNERVQLTQEKLMNFLQIQQKLTQFIDINGLIKKYIFLNY